MPKLSGFTDKPHVNIPPHIYNITVFIKPPDITERSDFIICISVSVFEQSVQTQAPEIRAFLHL